MLLDWWDDRQRAKVLQTWTGKPSPCVYSPLIQAVCPTPRRVLELGANWGGNLRPFLDAGAECVGIDPNVTVLHPDWPRYAGIVGDDRALRDLKSGLFDLAFTISVLDHLPTQRLVERAIRELRRLATTVVLLEPYIPGVSGNVSGKSRQQVQRGLPQGHKVFAPHSYLWNYPRWVGEGEPMPLYGHSLGPFYHRFVITTPSTPSLSSSAR